MKRFFSVDDLTDIFEDILYFTEDRTSPNAFLALVLGFSFIPRDEAKTFLKHTRFLTFNLGSRSFAPSEDDKDPSIILLHPDDLTSITDGIITVCHEAAHVALGHQDFEQGQDEYKQQEDEAWNKVNEWLPSEYHEYIDQAQRASGGNQDESCLRLTHGNWQEIVAAAIKELPTDLPCTTSNRIHKNNSISISVGKTMAASIEFYDEDGERGISVVSRENEEYFSFGCSAAELKACVQLHVVKVVLHPRFNRRRLLP